MSMDDLYIGVMSGTSVDNVDLCAVDFKIHPPKIVAKYTHAIPVDLKKDILDLCNLQTTNLQALTQLDAKLGVLFAEAVLALLKCEKLSTKDIKAIGCHGQTVYHGPRDMLGVTLQLGDGNRIAALTNIITINDFRRKDIALGGEGAPLVPAFHQTLFHSTELDRAILNIGGMSNITLLHKASDLVTGYDTGPGNVLLDTWVKKNLNLEYDANGTWARTGKICKVLLNKMLEHPFLYLRPPKSTGRESFNAQWLLNLLSTSPEKLLPEDVQNTLTHFTAKSIALGIEQSKLKKGEIIACGGGAYNCYLLELITTYLPSFRVKTSKAYDIEPEMIEPMAFAWLARQTMLKKTGNIPSVTGANRKAILGAIYLP